MLCVFLLLGLLLLGPLSSQTFDTSATARAEVPDKQLSDIEELKRQSGSEYFQNGPTPKSPTPDASPIEQLKSLSSTDSVEKKQNTQESTKKLGTSRSKPASTHSAVKAKPPPTKTTNRLGGIIFNIYSVITWGLLVIMGVRRCYLR